MMLAALVFISHLFRPDWSVTDRYSLSGVPPLLAVEEYFDTTVTATLKSVKEPFAEIDFAASFSSYCEPVIIERLRSPGLKQITEVLRVQFIIPTCGTEIYAHYFLVGKKGQIVPLPPIHYMINDNPDPEMAYVFPHEKYGAKNKIRLMQLTPEYGGTRVVEARVLEETAFQP